MDICRTCGEEETCCHCSIVSHPSPLFDCGYSRSRDDTSSRRNDTPFSDLLEENKKLKKEIQRLKKQLGKKY
jgi:hypothetical protein